MKIEFSLGLKWFQFNLNEQSALVDWILYKCEWKNYMKKELLFKWFIKNFVEICKKQCLKCGQYSAAHQKHIEISIKIPHMHYYTHLYTYSYSLSHYINVFVYILLLLFSLNAKI